MTGLALWGLRHRIYRHFAETGLPPARPTMVGWVGDETVLDGLLERLHAAHLIVLGQDRSIRMALPFSGVETPYRVVGRRLSWYANCAWDSLAIPAAVNTDARVEATWHDTGEAVDIAVVDGQLEAPTGFVHFSTPARRWWDDIVET